MSNHSGIGVSTQLAQELSQFAKGADFAVILAIVDEKCELAEKLVGAGDLEGNVDQLARALTARGVGYALVRIGDDKYVFGCFTPEQASSRDKMIYASSAELIRKQLPVTSEAQRWADADDFDSLKTSGEIAKSVGTSALSEQEVEQRRLGTEEQTRAAPQQSGANVSLALPNDAVKALGALTAGQLVTLVVRGEQLHMQENACGLRATQLQAHFGPEPTYAVWSGQEHERSDAKSGAVFIYRCPDDASAKERMVAASCRNGVFDAINKLTTINSTIETSDEIELPQTAPTGSSESEFIGTEVRQMRRPAKPGRVSRR